MCSDCLIKFQIHLAFSSDSFVADFSIYFSSGNPTTTKQATFGVKGPTAGSSCGVSSTQLSQPSYSYSGASYGTINDQTLDVQAYNIPLTGLGIYMGNDYSSGSGSWAGSIIIMTSSTGPSSSPTVKPSSPSTYPSSAIPSTMPSTRPSSSPTAKPSSPSTDPSTLPTEDQTLSPTEDPTLSPTEDLTLLPTEDLTLSPFVYPLSSLIVNLATLGTISACNYIQIPFSETGSILQSITFSGVSQSKLCICIMIDYY